MKKRLLILTLAVCAFLMLGSVSVLAADNDAAEGAMLKAVTPSARTIYIDVAPKDWYYNYVSFTSKHGIFQGYPTGDFAPNRNMTRAEVVRVLYTMEGEPTAAAGNRFSDVAVGEWYAEEVEWAASIGVVSGYPDGTFKPQLEVSRQDFVSMLYRYANYKEYNTEGRAELAFPDAGQTNPYAVEPFAWAIDAGIISGTVEADGIYLRPAASSTRAQVAKMLSVVAATYKDLGATDEVKIIAEEHVITVGCSRLIQYAVFPSATSLDEMTWTSSDETVATVSRGIVTGVSAGEATITATSFDGNSATCKVKVTEEPADPYRDVADYIELHANSGIWNESPCIMNTVTEDGVDYEYGIKMDYATGSVYFVSNIYAPDDGLVIETNFLTGGEWIGMISLTDSYEALDWYGECGFFAENITPNSDLSLDLFYCSEPMGEIPEMKAYLEETLTLELHAWLIDLDAIFADWGLKTTIKDFGFVNY